MNHRPFTSNDGLADALATLLCLAMAALTLLTASPAGAREMSSKRDCALCHVMWLDEFRSAQETLIPWQPGNVLMKNTQGLVSSEDSCYTCHDGYVKDSRSIAWKGKNHPAFVKPSQKIHVSEKLPLSNKDEVYCGTCHTPHVGPETADEKPLQNTSFLRVNYSTSQLCAMCHQDKADFERTNGHSLEALPWPVPNVLQVAGSKGGPDNRTMVCQTCHRIHGAKGEKISVMPDTSAMLCTACHTAQAGIDGTRHDLRLHKKTDGSAPVYKWGTCGGCHSPHDAKGKRLWNRDIGKANPASGMCLSCHADGPDAVARGIGAVSHSVNRRPDKKPTSALPLFLANGRPSTTQGKVQCSTCHNVHRWSPEDESKLPPENGQGHGGNSFLRMASAGDSAICLQCHNDKAAIVDTRHNLVHSAPEAVNAHEVTAATSGPCSACHLPHNANGWKLWARPLGAGHPASQACLTCHENVPRRPGKTIGKSHPVDVALSADHPAALPGYDAEGRIIKKGRMQCGTCHDVHRWQPGNPAEPIDPKAEGDAANSFLRMDNSGDAALCIGCHSQNTAVAATEHHIMKMAPDAVNSLNIRADSGQCSGCHVPHQATTDRLWGLVPGPGADPVTRRCNSCHNPDGLAKEKVVNTNSHPVGRKVSVKNQWTDADAEGKALLPLYNAPNGEKDLMVCTTCHNAHIWSPDKRKRRPGAVNTEGDTTTSFLRRANDANSSLCRDCHPRMSRVDGTVHDLMVSAPQTRNVLGQSPQASGVCGGCHVVHNSPNSLKLWARPLANPAPGELPVNTLCTSCHAQEKMAAKQVPEAAGHPPGKLMTNIRSRELLAGEAMPLFDKSNRRRSVGDLGCPSCHNAHQWRAGSKHIDPKASKSGHNRFKFLRASGRNLICAECHGPESLFRYLYYHDPERRGGVRSMRQ